MELKTQIRQRLQAFSGADLRDASIGLLTSLGYRSEKTLDLDNTPDAFLAKFDKRDRKFRNEDKIVYRGLIYRRTVKVVKIVTGAKK